MDWVKLPKKNSTIAPVDTPKGIVIPYCMLMVLCAILFALSGCRQDYSLSPPADSEKVSVTVRLPKELALRTLQVMYRSASCKRASRGASGQRLEEDGFHSIDMPLERQGQSDLYQANLPMDGGGACRWHLSNVVFGVTYGEPTYFGERVTWGAGGGVLVKFDRNRSMRGSGSPVVVDGDLTIRKDYYTWLHERFLGGYAKTISLAREGDIFLEYQALRARQVYFEPMFHSDFLVKSEGVKVKSERNFITFTYPDGSVESDRRSQPDFLKLQSLRTGRAGDCLSPWTYHKCPGRSPQLLPEWLPVPDKPGFGQYLIVDEWGNKLPTYDYRLVGKDGRINKWKTDANGLTYPVPESMHPLREVEFP